MQKPEAELGSCDAPELTVAPRTHQLRLRPTAARGSQTAPGGGVLRTATKFPRYHKEGRIRLSPCADLQKRPRLPNQPGSDGGLNCHNLSFVNGQRNVSYSHNMNNTGDGKNREAI